MRGWYFILIIVSINCSLYSCQFIGSENDACQVIHIDLSASNEEFDFKDLTDSTFMIIPLETNDHALLCDIYKIEIRNDMLFILDKMAQSVFIFDMQGQLVNRLHAVGQGPGEYVHLSYITVTDSTLIVLDHFSGKQLEYNIPDLTFLRASNVFNSIWAVELFTLNDRIYYVNSWGNTKIGKYRLFSCLPQSAEYEKYLSFENEPVALGINGPQYAICGNTASLIFSGDDHIYRINEKREVYPEYVVTYNVDKVKYLSGDVTKVLEENPKGRVLGINSIFETDSYLFLNISMTGDTDYTCIYNKQDAGTVVYPQVAYNSLINNEQVVSSIIDNKTIFWRNAHDLLLMKTYIYDKRTFTNKEFEKRVYEVINSLKEDDNPVLFIYNLKT